MSGLAGAVGAGGFVVAMSAELRFRLWRKLRPLPCSSSSHKIFDFAGTPFISPRLLLGMSASFSLSTSPCRDWQGRQGPEASSSQCPLNSAPLLLLSPQNLRFCGDPFYKPSPPVGDVCFVFSQYIPMSGLGAAAGAGGSGLSATRASVVSRTLAMEAAFSKAVRVTLVGSTMPSFTIST